MPPTGMSNMDSESLWNDETEPFSETEDDLPGLTNAIFQDALVVSTDWTSETLLSQIRRGNVELDPVFQRRDAWDRRKKSHFIESVIVGLPVPQIVLAERKGSRGSYLVLDGKQRLLTLMQFANGDYRLSGLTLRTDLNRCGIDDLPADDRLALETQTIRTVVVRNWQREEFLYLVFLRLNTGSVSLSPQELRQALHPGDFVRFVNTYTVEHLEFAQLLRRDKPDFRMRDVELLVRYFALIEFLPNYNGNLKDLLDETCMELNRRWDSSAPAIHQQADSCLLAIQATTEIFGQNSFRRWNFGRYERPFNRAIFDVMTFYARQADVRDEMLRRPDIVRSSFQGLCEAQPRFIESITTTTKSTEAIFNRLSLWGNVLRENLALPIEIPARATDGHIAYAAL